ncbi:hypothetical protein JW872_02220 [Candidatus Babeliales bacterium]|nr:hypothetical protein [Candidatus Babeliales bacterium]
MKLLKWLSCVLIVTRSLIAAESDVAAAEPQPAAQSIIWIAPTVVVGIGFVTTLVNLLLFNRLHHEVDNCRRVMSLQGAVLKYVYEQQSGRKLPPKLTRRIYREAFRTMERAEFEGVFGAKELQAVLHDKRLQAPPSYHTQVATGDDSSDGEELTVR